MTYKRPISWMHRWSRPIMAGIASIGAAVTAYLTYSKLTGTAACPTEGCNIVLSSPYATVLGLPLTLFGFFAYASVVILAVVPLLVNEVRTKDLRNNLEIWTSWLLFIGTTAMLVFSGYLMYLLAFEVKALCVYCVASALFSTILFILALAGQKRLDVGQLFFAGTIVATVVLVGTLGVYANVHEPTIAITEERPAVRGIPITTTAGTAEIALAKHLNQVGAKFYGAFWCHHCHDQKQLFGKESLQYLPYVECSTPDRRRQTATCEEQKIESYPTWRISGQSFSGTEPLEKLADLTGYQGPRNFQNALPAG